MYGTLDEKQMILDTPSFSPGDKQQALIRRASAWRSVLFAACVSSLTAATLGYDVGIIAAAIEFINSSFHLSHIETQLVVGSLNFVSAFGALIAGTTADALGRKVTVWLCCALYVVGTALMALAPNFETLLLGRTVTGLGVGVSFVVVPVYISEITPSDYRGMLSTLFDISINIGIVLGYIVGFIVADMTTLFGAASNFTDETKWRVMLGVGGFLPAFVIVSLTVLPESPRWLMSCGRTDEARLVLLGFLGDPALVEASLQAIQDAMKAETDPLFAVKVNLAGRDDCTRCCNEGATAEKDLVQDEANLPLGLLEYDGLSFDAGIQYNAVLESRPKAARELAWEGGSSSDSRSNIDDVQKSEMLKVLTWREVLGIDALEASDQYLHRVIWIVVGVGFWQQATGSEAVLYYSNIFLERAGLISVRQRLLGYILIGTYGDGAGNKEFVNSYFFVFCFCMGPISDFLTIYRMCSPLLLTSALGVTAAIFTLGMVFSTPSVNGTTVVFLLSLYMVLFSFGMGPVTWLLASEMLPSRARAKGMTLCSFVNRLTSGVVALTALSTCDALGFSYLESCTPLISCVSIQQRGFFAFYGCVSLVGTGWYAWYVPETRGKSLEEINDFLKNNTADVIAASATKTEKHRPPRT